MQLIEYPDSEMMMMHLADMLASELKSTLMRNDVATFAVPGGTTPGPVFDTLSGVALDWDRVRVMLTDERRVPVASPRSNERLVRERLLVNRAASAQFISYLPQSDTDTVADLASRVAPHLPISVLLLGMGADMHTASIFPNSGDLANALSTQDPILGVQPPDGLEPRLTLSMSALKAAMSCHIVIIGPEKRAALERAAQLSPDVAPVSALLPNAIVHWTES